MRYDITIAHLQMRKVMEYSNLEGFRVEALEEAQRRNRIQILRITESGVMA